MCQRLPLRIRWVTLFMTQLATEVEAIFSWDSVTQTSEWGVEDSTDIRVEWTGKSEVQWYWVRLECPHAYSYFLDTHRDRIADSIHARFTQVNTAYGPLLFRLNNEDERPPSVYEGLRYRKYLLDSCVAHDGKSAPNVLSEISATQSPSFHGIVKSREAWVGLSITRSEWINPYMDHGFNNDTTQIQAHQGINIGYDDYFHVAGSNWHDWQTYELGPIGMQTALGTLARDGLVPAAKLRLGGMRWLADPIFCGKFERSTGLYMTDRTAVSTEIRALCT
jgi:hypothetical protein